MIHPNYQWIQIATIVLVLLWLLLITVLWIWCGGAI